MIVTPSISSDVARSTSGKHDATLIARLSLNSTGAVSSQHLRIAKCHEYVANMLRGNSSCRTCYEDTKRMLRGNCSGGIEALLLRLGVTVIIPLDLLSL